VQQGVQAQKHKRAGGRAPHLASALREPSEPTPTISQSMASTCRGIVKGSRRKERAGSLSCRCSGMYIGMYDAGLAGGVGFPAASGTIPLAPAVTSMAAWPAPGRCAGRCTSC
jgi:hypothetical protein